MSPRRFTSVLLSCVAATVGLGACDDYSLQARLGAPRTGFSQGGLAGDVRLVGVWSRVIYFTDAAGQTYSSQTTWAFERDADARRTLVVTNLVTGASEVSVHDGVWRTEGRVLIVDFSTAPGGVLRLPYDVDGGQLLLGDLVFLRVVP